jgi:hypothetical protein
MGRPVIQAVRHASRPEPIGSSFASCGSTTFARWVFFRNASSCSSLWPMGEVGARTKFGIQSVISTLGNKVSPLHFFIIFFSFFFLVFLFSLVSFCYWFPFSLSPMWLLDMLLSYYFSFFIFLAFFSFFLFNIILCLLLSKLVFYFSWYFMFLFHLVSKYCVSSNCGLFHTLNLWF